MVFDPLRSNWTHRYGHNNIDDWIHFLNAPYPNLSRIAWIDLQQLKYKIEHSYVIIQYENSNNESSFFI